VQARVNLNKFRHERRYRTPSRSRFNDRLDRYRNFRFHIPILLGQMQSLLANEDSLTLL
jgi:hypothetical protein